MIMRSGRYKRLDCMACSSLSRNNLLVFHVFEKNIDEVRVVYFLDVSFIIYCILSSFCVSLICDLFRNF